MSSTPFPEDRPSPLPAPVSAHTAAPKVGVPTRLVYGVGSVAFGVKDNGFTFFLLLFYNQVLGLPAAWVGAALMVALVVDGVADPIVGQLSDHWRSRLGRRHPFMYAAALPAAIGYALLWNPPDGLGPTALFTWLIVTTVAVRLAVAAYEVPSSALVAELSESYDQRTALLSYRMFLAWCGGLMMTIVSYQVFLVPTAEHAAGQLNPEGYTRMGLFGGMVMLAAILVSTAGTHRFIPHLKRPTAGRPKTMREGVSEIAAALSNRSLLMLLGAGLASSLAIGVGSALNIYLATFFWGLSTAQISILASGLFGGAVIAFVATTPLSRRFDKRACGLAAGFVHVAASLVPIALRLMGFFPANGDPILLPLLMLSYLASTAAMVTSMILTTSMLADVVEDNEVRTGRRTEGVVFSANLFIQKCVSGVGIFSAGLLLTLIAFPEHARPGAVTPNVLGTLGLSFGATQLVCYGLSILFLLGYRITRHAHEANLATLRARAD